jgi:hypothetical protein
MKKTRAIVFAVAGLLVLLFSAWELFSVRSFLGRAVKAEGTVVWLNSGGSHPEIRFRTPSGQAITYAQNGLIFGFKEDDKVTVLYDPAKPQDASIDDSGALWGFPSLFALLGLVFVAASWFIRK